MTLRSGHPREEGETYAALYVLGALPSDEVALFEAHLETGCDQCRQDVQAMEQVSTDLAVSLATTPAAGVRQRLLDSLGQLGSPGQTMNAGRATIRAGSTPWKASGFPGITIRQLHSDRQNGRQTLLVRMAAGASYLPHRHDGLEETFVLEGEITCDGETLSAGDYHRAEAGTQHGAQTTTAGCMVLIISAGAV